MPGLRPALQWHLRLLAQLLGEFYLAKRREAKLRETSYLQAVHETGARTTHDIKNLLQSLNVLCSAAAAQEADTRTLNALVRFTGNGFTLDVPVSYTFIQPPITPVPSSLTLVMW